MACHKIQLPFIPETAELRVSRSKWNTRLSAYRKVLVFNSRRARGEETSDSINVTRCLKQSSPAFFFITVTCRKNRIPVKGQSCSTCDILIFSFSPIKCRSDFLYNFVDFLIFNFKFKKLNFSFCFLFYRRLSSSEG